MNKHCLSQAFLLLTNKTSQPIVNLAESLDCAVKHLGDMYIIYHDTFSGATGDWSKFNVHSFSDAVLARLNYSPIFESLLPGSNHFPLLDFYLKYPCYDYYWYIEDDVRYNGNWQDFFQSLYFSTEPDFISCHIKTFIEEPRWRWWRTLAHPCSYIPVFSRIRSFNPIFRISNRALLCIHHFLLDKWQGHHEVLLPTILSLEGFEIRDFGGSGKFVSSEYKNRFYESDVPNVHGTLETGTMRYRPVLEPCEIQELKLYHPVKF